MPAAPRNPGRTPSARRGLARDHILDQSPRLRITDALEPEHSRLQLWSPPCMQPKLFNSSHAAFRSGKVGRIKTKLLADAPRPCSCRSNRQPSSSSHFRNVALSIMSLPFDQQAMGQSLRLQRGLFRMCPTAPSARKERGDLVRWAGRTGAKNWISWSTTAKINFLDGQDRFRRGRAASFANP